MKKIKILILYLVCSGGLLAQWPNNSLLNSGNTLFGTSFNAPINIFTNGNQRAQFSTGVALNTPWDFSGPFNPNGDGLRIYPQTGTSGYLDLFTGNQSTTHIKWGNSGSISGQNGRFEQHGNGSGFFYNTVGGGVFKFAHNSTVNCFVGQNNFWRIGQQNDGSNFAGFRRLEVVDNAHQFRLTFAAPNTISGPFTDFLSNSSGNLQILPQGGRVGINITTNPTHNLEVGGDARIRNVPLTTTPNCIIVGTNQTGAADNQISRLDFSGNANQVLLGNGTWGTLPPNNPPVPNLQANNGVSRSGNNFQLGDVYNPFPIPINTNTPLMSNRQVRLNNNNFIFSGSGNVGIGLSWPTMPSEVLDVNGNGRFRNIPEQGGQSLLLGLQQGTNSNDIEFSRLEFTGNNSDVLLGDGTWGSAAVSITADNGVRLSPNSSNIQLGQTNTGLGLLNGGELIQNTEIPMNDNNLYFYGASNLSNNVYIGEPIAPLPLFALARLNVYRETNQLLNIPFAVGGMFSAQNTYSNNNTTVAVWGNVSGVSGTTGQIFAGGLFRVSGEGTGGTYGVRAHSGGGNRVYGVYGNATGSGMSGSFARGGEFEASNAETNYGIFTTASGGVTNYAAYFDGDVIILGAINPPSDENLKNNIQSISEGMIIINQLQPKTFEFDQEGYPSMHFSSGLQYGLIAQEVEQILPDLVSENVHPAVLDSLGNLVHPAVEFKGLNYTQLIPILIRGLQEQDARIDSLTNVNLSINTNNDSLILAVADLNARITLLENCLSNILPALCQANQMAIQQTPQETQEYLEKTINITLSNRNNIILNQNVPNPFAESTVISFSIPSTVQKAQLHFYDGQGKLINTVEINERGNGQVNVFANDLSTGVYTYSLVADGQVVSTKRMMKN